MFGLSILLVATAALAHVHASDVRPPPAPYVESREAFSNARTYLSEALDPNVRNIYDLRTRTHYSFGILADVTAGIVTANRTAPNYDPLHVVDKHVPYAWRNYREVASRAQELLNEASAKIRLMEDLIDNICDAESVSQCNHEVQAKVLASPHAYELPAELLLLLGRVSTTIMKHQHTLDAVTKRRTEIPHLIDNVQKNDFNDFVVDLDLTYKKMRQLQFRRFMSHFSII